MSHRVRAREDGSDSMEFALLSQERETPENQTTQHGSILAQRGNRDFKYINATDNNNGPRRLHQGFLLLGLCQAKSFYHPLIMH